MFANLDPRRAPSGRQSHFTLSLPSSRIFHQVAILEDPILCFYLSLLLLLSIILCSEYMRANRIFCSLTVHLFLLFTLYRRGTERVHLHPLLLWEGDCSKCIRTRKTQ